MRVARRWNLGLRGEVLGLPRGRSYDQHANLLLDPRGYVASAAITWNLSEFARVRLHGEGHFHDRAADGAVKNFAVVLVQLEYSMGAHGAHPF